MPKPISESITLLETSTPADADNGVRPAEFLTPGWGSSGYYSAEVIEAAAPLFAVGTHMYFDHPTDAEATARPGRSVRDLCAVIVEAGTVDKTTGGIRGKIKPFAPYRDLLLDEDFTKNIGLSIRGSATDITVGEAEGRTGPIVEGLADITSVDFVTRAGRGGRVLSVMESARPEQVVQRAVAHGVEEATADERRQQLSDAVRTAYAGNDRYAWVQDFDETTVWFQASLESERSRTWQQAYAISADDMAVSLIDERIEVRPITKYVPVTRSDSNTPTTTESLEDNMAKIQIEESAHTELVEKAGRVPTLESERDTAVRERDAARTELAEHHRTERARTLIAERAKEAGVSFTPREVKGLLADVTVNESGEFDEAAFITLVDGDAKAKLAESTGSGLVGFGASAETNGTVEEAAPTTNPWGRPLTSVKGA